jgi:uncharacterized membrane protein (DUF485 family)
MADQPRTRHRGPSVYEVIQASEEFGTLRSTFRSFVVPAAIAFLSWYFLFVLLAAFAPGFMALRLVGAVNVGIVLGLLQFVSTFAITMLYGRWARARLDPLADELRERIEDGEFG